MRRTALALFVVKPTHLRCGKLDLIQAKSKFRMEATHSRRQPVSTSVPSRCPCRMREFSFTPGFSGKWRRFPLVHNS